MKNRIITFVLILFLTGCAIAPGYRPLGGFGFGVKIQLITSDLILAQKAKEVKAVQQSIIQNQKAEDYTYQIGVRDILDISIWGYPEFGSIAVRSESTEVSNFLVRDDGSINFPFIGRVDVAGKTADEVHLDIAQRIKPFIKDPIYVKVATYRSKKLYVTGEVTTPGIQPITDVPLTIVDAISLAGGTGPNADLINVSLTRDRQTYVIDLLSIYTSGDTKRNPILKNGDILHVPSKSARKVRVIGEVRNPSSLLMDRRTISLTEAINEAGGINLLTANPARIYVIRGSFEAPKIYRLNAKTPAGLILGEHFRLKSSDIVYVETAGVTRWNRVVSQILPTTGLVGIPQLFAQE